MCVHSHGHVRTCFEGKRASATISKMQLLELEAIPLAPAKVQTTTACVLSADGADDAARDSMHHDLHAHPCMNPPCT